MEKKSDETKPGLERALVLARSDVVRTKQSQNFTNSKGNRTKFSSCKIFIKKDRYFQLFAKLRMCDNFESVSGLNEDDDDGKMT